MSYNFNALLDAEEEHQARAELDQFYDDIEEEKPSRPNPWDLPSNGSKPPSWLTVGNEEF